MEDRARILTVPSVGPLTVSPRGAITSLLLDGFSDRILVIESDMDNLKHTTFYTGVYRPCTC